MQLDRFTQKAQEAIVAAQATAERLQSPVLDAEHLLSALVEPDDGIPAETLRRLGVDLPAFRGELAAILAKRARIQGGSITLDPRAKTVIERAEAEARRLGDEFVSTEHLLLGIAEVGGEGQALLERHAAGTRGHPPGAPERPRRPARDIAEPRGHLRRPREVRSRPHGRGPGRQARSGHRPRRRGPPRHPGPVAPDQEQPGPHRRARRRQDGHRRGARPAHRARRRPGGPQEQAGRRARPRRADRRRQVPRRVRGAAQGRAQGDQGLRRPGRPVHRRAAHRRRRGRRRGRDGRLEPAQADARPRRAAHDRRDDARRVPQAHREGRGPRAALPAGARGRADGRGDHLDPARPARALRGPPRRPHHGLRAGRGGHALEPLHHRTLPARQGDRPRRRGREPPPDGDRLDADRARRARAPTHPARDRARGPAQGDRRRLEGAARGAREGAGRPRGRGRRDEAALGGREVGDRRDPRHEVGARGPPGPHRAGRAGGRLRDRRRAQVRDAQGADRPPGRAGGDPDDPAGSGIAAQGGGHRRRHRRDRGRLDRHPGQPPDGGRDGQAPPHGGAAPRPGRRPGRGHPGRLRRGPSRPRRAQGPAPADRLVPVPRTDRRRQDRARPGTRRVPVRRRARAGPHRHERVHGEVLRVAARRGTSRLCRLRGGRPADRGRPPAAVPGGAPRRDREGAPGRVQRPAPGPRRRPPDRRPGPDGRFPQHRRDHDEQHRQHGHRRVRGTGRATTPTSR